MCRCGITFGVSAIAAITSSVKSRGCGLVKRTRSQPVDVAAGPQQLAESEPVAERAAVGVDVLAEQGDLDDAVVDQRPDLGQHVAGRRSVSAPRSDGTMQNVQVLSQPTEIDTQALYGDFRAASAGRTGRSAAPRAISTCASLLCRARSSSTGRAARLCVPNTTSTHGACSRMRAAVLLRQAAADRDLHARVARLGRVEVAEVAVEPVVGVLAHGAGVEHDEVGVVAVAARDVAGRLEQAGEPLGVVHVHLAPVRADVVRAFAMLTREAGRCVRSGCHDGIEDTVSRRGNVPP